MKKFKSNVTITFLYTWMGIIVPLIPMLIIIGIAAEPSEWFQSFVVFPILFIFILLMVIFLSLINLIIQLFLKVKVVLEKDYFVYNNISINYKNVTRIAFDTGNRSEPCSLSFFNKDKLLCSINRAPFIMTLLLKKKCHNAHFEFYNKKEFLILFFICSGMGIIFSLIILFQK